MATRIVPVITLFCALACARVGAEETESPGAPPLNALPDYGRVIRALQAGDVEGVLQLTEGSGDEQLRHIRAKVLQGRGEMRFFQGDIEGSVADFDEVVDLLPDREPYHWQRGISLYYAGEFERGRRQFERHQTVNDQDVENAVWHFLCSVRSPGGSVESARENFIPITGDSRVPMKEVHALFAGEGTVEAVLEAARAEGNPRRSERARNAMCYTHLYLALYYEATGEDEEMKKHIALAANDFRMDHYMGRVARVHAAARGVRVEPGVGDL